MNFVDLDGRFYDEWIIHSDGTLSRRVNSDKYDEFYIENNDNTLEYVAKLDKYTTKDGVDLVEFPSSGIGFTRYGEQDEGGDHSIQPSAAAALFGAVNDIYKYDNNIIIQFGDIALNETVIKEEVSFDTIEYDIYADNLILYQYNDSTITNDTICFSSHSNKVRLNSFVAEIDSALFEVVNSIIYKYYY